MSENVKFFFWCLFMFALSVAGLSIVDGPNEPKVVRPVFVMIPTGIPVVHISSRIPNRLIIGNRVKRSLP